MLQSFCVAAQLAASHEGLSSMKLVTTDPGSSGSNCLVILMLSGSLVRYTLHRQSNDKQEDTLQQIYTQEKNKCCIVLLLRL
jgi:hypothetical protein